MDNQSFRLKPKLNFYQNRQRFWIGLLCGLGIAMGLFYVQLILLQCGLYFAREFQHAFIVIPANQLRWFVGFFAAVGFLGGSSVALLIWLQRHKAGKRSRKFLLSMATNDQSNVFPSFLHAYFKFAFVILILFLSFPSGYPSNNGLPDMLKAFIVLLSFALLFNQWINVRRYFKVKLYWVVLHICIWAASSFALSFIGLPLESYLKAQFIKERPYLNLNIQYPILLCDDNLYYPKGSIAGDWYLGFDSGIVSNPIMSFYQPHSFYQEDTSLDYMWDNRALRFFFDARLPMAAVDSFVLHYRKTKVNFLEGNKALLPYNCSAQPDSTLLMPPSFLALRFNSCDPEKNILDNVYDKWIPIKITASVEWFIKDEVYSEEKLWIALASEKLKWIMLTYEANTSLEQVLQAFVYFNQLKRPLDWKGYRFYLDKGLDVPHNRFELSLWFISIDICFDQSQMNYQPPIN
ncbi:hypothetical protein BH09BAC1_BH09BAC1_12210 [soil metagenome]